MLLGMNCGRSLDALALPTVATSLSSDHDFDLQVRLSGPMAGVFCHLCFVIKLLNL